jgi:hypothetical protein
MDRISQRIFPITLFTGERISHIRLYKEEGHGKKSELPFTPCVGTDSDLIFRYFHEYERKDIPTISLNANCFLKPMYLAKIMKRTLIIISIVSIWLIKIWTEPTTDTRPDIKIITSIKHIKILYGKNIILGIG